MFQELQHLNVINPAIWGLNLSKVMWYDVYCLSKQREVQRHVAVSCIICRQSYNRNTSFLEHTHKCTKLVIPWNSMDLLVSSKLARSKFHGGLKGTTRVIGIGALHVPWNSMERLLSSKMAHSKFHGIPWNCSFHRNWRTPSSMEFHVTPWNCSSHWNCRIPSSVKFNGNSWIW